MSDPMFDLNFLGSSASTGSHSMLMDPTLQSFPMSSGIDHFSSQSSIFDHLTTDKPSVPGTSIATSQPTPSSSLFPTTQSFSLCSEAQPHTPSFTDYSKHFSEDFSTASENYDSTLAVKNESLSEVKEETKPEVAEAPCISSEDPEASHVLNVVINNVVCSFSTRCHLNVKRVAREGANVIFKPENGMVSMKLRKPYVTANIWSSGKITITGSTSDEESKIAARRVSRCLQKLGFKVHFGNYRVVNVLGTCSFPFGIKITHFSRDHPKDCSYEPELHPGATFKISDLKATLKIFSTGSITVTAPKVENVQLAVQRIYPLVLPYRMSEPEEGEETESLNLATTHLMSGNNKRVSKFDLKRKRHTKKLRYYAEDSDGEVWSDSTDVEVDSDEEDDECY